MRSLAHIEKITNIKPIEGADKIVVATVLGWECVVKKDEFKINDLVIYVEVDSVLPKRPEYQFLESRNYRIRTIKLKGQISQGLILPLDILTKDSKDSKVIKNCLKEGFDCTEDLGITKYLTLSEQEEINKQINHKHWTKKYLITNWLWKYKWFRRYVLPNKEKHPFPEWVAKTDEERIQNIPYVISQFANHEMYVTEKIDYQSVTFTGKMVNKFNWLGKLSPKKFQFVVCSRNLVNNDKNSLYWKIAEKYNIEKILKENPTLTIQGEQGDIKVQGNKYGITEPTMWVFNIINYEKNYHYNYGEMNVFCNKYNLPIVPLVTTNDIQYMNFPKLWELGATVQELVEFSKGKSVINPNIEREGIVVRCIENGKKILSFKVINPNFLLKYSD